MTNTRQKLIRLFRKDARGSTAVIFGLTVFFTAVISGLAMDFSRVSGQRSTLQIAADAAALAIGHDKDVSLVNMEARARDFVTANLQSVGDVKNIAVKASRIDDGTGVQVKVDAQVGTLLLGVFGVTEMGVEVVSEAKYSSAKVEVTLALDNTGSMSGSKLNTLKSASTSMVNFLMPEDTDQDKVKIGIVPFDVSVNIGTDKAGKPWLTNTDGHQECTRWSNGGSDTKDNGGGDGNTRQCVSWKHYDWEGCVAPRKEPDDATDKAPVDKYRYSGVYGNATDCGIAKITPLSTDRDQIKSEINNMRANGRTYVPIGLEWGWRLLAPEAPYAGAAAYDDKEWRKILVLMTDGDNTVQWKEQGPQYLPIKSGSSKADERTKLICRAIKDKGITIYTVAFKVNNKNTRKMLEECATDSNRYFDAQDSHGLESAFAKIANDINSLYLSK